jgi:hypothetical protein
MDDVRRNHMISEPKTSLDAILENPAEQPFTLARWAMLLKFKAIGISDSETTDPIKTLFIMYAPTDELMLASESEALFNERALRFADTIPVSDAESMMQRAIKKIQEATYMVQESTSSDKKKLQATGS